MGFLNWLLSLFRKPASPKTEIELSWMKVVSQEMGVTEIPGPKSNKRILEYHAATKLHASSDSIAWCSAFANWVFQQVEIPGTGSAAALSWLDWGRAILKPQYGCVVVFDHENGHGHVTFFVREEGDYLICRGGNQSDSVRESKYSKVELAGYRWPA